MIYTLFIWTVTAVWGDRHGIGGKVYDWRALATVESMYMDDKNEVTMKTKCELVAQQLGLKSENYRCIRTK